MSALKHHTVANKLLHFSNQPVLMVNAAAISTVNSQVRYIDSWINNWPSCLSVYIKSCKSENACLILLRNMVAEKLSKELWQQQSYLCTVLKGMV